MWVVLLGVLSSCDTCCRMGGQTCDTAFHDQPGQCCGFENGAGKCCPHGARCVQCPLTASFYFNGEDEIRCVWPGEHVTCGRRHVTLDLLNLFLIGTLVGILLLSCCPRSHREPHEIYTVSGTPVCSATATTTAVPVVAANATPSGSNTVVAMGTGLLGGMLLSDALEAGYHEEEEDTGFVPDASHM